MSIKIRTEKIVEKGIAKRKILAIEGVIPYDELPTEYLQASPYAFLQQYTDRQILIMGVVGCADISDTMEEVEFQKSLNGLKVCGERLHEINQKIKALKETWNGEETFII